MVFVAKKGRWPGAVGTVRRRGNALSSLFPDALLGADGKFEDTLGADPAEVGDAVLLWRGRGDATQSSALDAPVLAANGGLTFDGLSDYLNTNWVPGANPGTIMARVAVPASLPGIQSWFIAARDNGPSRHTGIGVQSSTGRLAYWLGDQMFTPVGNDIRGQTGVAALTWGGDGQPWALYWNGVEIASGTQAGDASTRPFFIGAANRGTADQFYSGTIYNVGYADRALSAAEILAASRAMSPPLTVSEAPVLGALTDGDTLEDAFTSGAYAGGTGTITVTRQMRVDGGTWQTYSASQAVVEGEVWEVRETATDATGLTITRTTAAVEVAQGFTLETGDDTIIGGASLTDDGSGNLTLTVASGDYAGTYTTDYDGTPLTRTLLNTGQPILIVAPVVTESPADTHTATPGLWLASRDMEFTQRYTSGGVEVATGATYVHSGTAQVEYRETASTGVGDPVEWSTIVEAASGATYSFLGADATASGHPSHSLSAHTYAVDIGTAAADRYILVGISIQNADPDPVVTVAGVTLTKLAFATDNNAAAGFYGGVVSTGDGMQNVVVTWTSATFERKQMAVWRLDDLASTTPKIAVTGAGGTFTTGSIAAGDLVFFMGYANSTAGLTFSGGTEAPDREAPFGTSGLSADWTATVTSSAWNYGEPAFTGGRAKVVFA